MGDRRKALTPGHLKTAVNWGCSFSSASLFLPAAGVCYDTDLNDAGNNGNYWSRSVNSDDPNNAWNLYFNDEDDYCMSYDDRYFGQSVRPVLGYS